MRISLIGGLILTLASAVHADEPKNLPDAIEVKVSAGTGDGRFAFVPNQLTFERGKYYKLVIHNPSKEDHYFSSDAFATHIFTRKVEVMDPTGRTVAEIHGAVNEIELKTGTQVAWYFYPMTRGERLKLYCHKEGHEDKGMTGTIDIVGPPPFTN